MFVEKLAPGVRVIIPHLGFLNGGYGTIRDAGLWNKENVYADTSLASRDNILDFIDRYGHEKLLFGSDFPFGSPRRELQKILELPVPEEKVEAIVGKNLERLFFGRSLFVGFLFGDRNHVAWFGSGVMNLKMFPVLP